MVVEVQNGIDNNSSLKITDVFDVDKNDKAKTELAKAVLSSVYVDGNGELNARLQDIKSYMRYEPSVRVNFEKKDGKITPEINPMINITPKLVVFDQETQMFNEYNVCDKVMEEQKLKAKLRLPAVLMNGKPGLAITSYDDDDAHNILQKQTKLIKSTGSEAYVEIKVDKCNSFEIENDAMTIYFVSLIAIIVVICAVVTIIIVRRRKKKAQAD